MTAPTPQHLYVHDDLTEAAWSLRPRSVEAVRLVGSLFSVMRAEPHVTVLSLAEQLTGVLARGGYLPFATAIGRLTFQSDIRLEAASSAANNRGRGYSCGTTAAAAPAPATMTIAAYRRADRGNARNSRPRAGRFRAVDFVLLTIDFPRDGSLR